jgi:hypothetical protein
VIEHELWQWEMHDDDLHHLDEPHLSGIARELWQWVIDDDLTYLLLCANF